MIYTPITTPLPPRRRYGYYNTKMLDYRGVQWRFHPHACPQIPRDYPGGYAATAASSWIRSNLDPDFINARGLVCDFVETPELGDRSFKERMFDPAEVRNISKHVVIIASHVQHSQLI